MNDTVKVAVAQVGTVLFDQDKTLAKLESYVQQAAQEKAELVLFPEAFVGGYPKGIDFGATLGIRTDKGRERFQNYFDQAIEVPGEITVSIGELAKKHQIEIVTGAVEQKGGTLYCTTLHFDKQGELIHHHRKIMPTAHERVVWGQGDGSSLTVSKSDVGKVGKLICWENYMPLARQALYDQGVEIYCAPTVDDRDAWIPTLQHIARESRCFVLSSCQYLEKSNYPEEVLSEARNLSDLPIRGGSCIISPMGEFIEKPVYGKEGLLYAILHKKDLAQAKYDLDLSGHYSRPDIFEFRVKTQNHSKRSDIGS